MAYNLIKAILQDYKFSSFQNIIILRLILNIQFILDIRLTLDISPTFDVILSELLYFQSLIVNLELKILEQILKTKNLLMRLL